MAAAEQTPWTSSDSPSPAPSAANSQSMTPSRFPGPGRASAARNARPRNSSGANGTGTSRRAWWERTSKASFLNQKNQQHRQNPRLTHSAHPSKTPNTILKYIPQPKTSAPQNPQLSALNCAGLRSDCACILDPEPKTVRQESVRSWADTAGDGGQDPRSARAMRGAEEIQNELSAERLPSYANAEDRPR